MVVLWGKTFLAVRYIGKIHTVIIITQGTKTIWLTSQIRSFYLSLMRRGHDLGRIGVRGAPGALNSVYKPWSFSVFCSIVRFRKFNHVFSSTTRRSVDVAGRFWGEFVLTIVVFLFDDLQIKCLLIESIMVHISDRRSRRWDVSRAEPPASDRRGPATRALPAPAGLCSGAFAATAAPDVRRRAGAEEGTLDIWLRGRQEACAAADARLSAKWGECLSSYSLQRTWSILRSFI